MPAAPTESINVLIDTALERLQELIEWTQHNARRSRRNSEFIQAAIDHANIDTLRKAYVLIDKTRR